MIIIGITGSIGMGKTTIAHMLKRFNIPVFDSDKEVKDILENNNLVKEQVYKLWPDVILIQANEKKIDKNLLSRKIFADKDNRKILENIVHPLVHKRRNCFINNANNSFIIALDVPLLYETGTDKVCDDILLAYTSEKNQKVRVLSRPNMTLKKFNLIKNAQWSTRMKREKNPYLISTSYGKLISFIMISIYLVIIIFKKKVLKL